MSEDIKGSSTKKKPSPLSDHYLVAIGASAGGLEAIHLLFDHFPNNSSFSFVIIQHLSPDHKSLMAELLAKHTRMQVQEAEDKMFTKPNCVYVLPSGKQLTLEHGRLRLADKERTRNPNFAIDLFFESMAKDRGQYAIGVILSGTGTDGTKGAKAIKKAKGMVVVQDPDTAKFDGMPRSAIHAGNMDYVLPPEQMPEEIIKYTQKVPLIRAMIEKMGEESEEKVLDEILALICTHTQTDFSNYKKATIGRRIRKRMAHLNLDTLKEYLVYLQREHAEIKLLCQEFFINVTQFFRDPEAFEILSSDVIPAILQRKEQNAAVKVWISACSTGEEAYSLAILFCEAYQKLGRKVNVKLFATDIDQRAITQASKGVYPASIEADVSEERLNKYFYRNGTQYVVREEVRRLVVFAQHDLQKDPPFSQVDLITCRNMLIYLNSELQNKVLSLFPYALNLNGYLLLGPSEHIGDMAPYFSEENRKWKLFRKVKESQGIKRYSSSNYSPAIPTQSYQAVAATYTQNTAQVQYTNAFMDAVSDDFKVTGFYVDENYQLLHGIGDMNRFLKFPDKRLHFNLLKMVPEALAVTLSVGVRKALKDNERTTSQVGVKLGDERQLVHVSIKPITNDASQGRTILILLQEMGPEKPTPGALPLPSVTDSDYFQQMTSMEMELKSTRESLHLTVQDLSTANEELQSSNEELMSANEELQSSNEEMQSLNEELHTVNSEHQLKIRELEELNEDLDNYFRSSNIGQLFIDHQLIIRKFTPTIKDLINIIDSDIGRPVHHLSHNLKYDSLLEDIRKVNNSSQEIEKELETQTGHCYLMRIIPYLKRDGNKDGIVLSFVNVTATKTLSNVVQGVLNSSLSSIMALKAVRDEEGEVTDFTWSLLNHQAEDLLGKTNAQLTGVGVQKEMGFLRTSGLFKKFVHVMQTGEPLHIEQQLPLKNQRTWYEIVAVKMGDGLTVTMADISEKKHGEEKTQLAYEELKKAEEKLLQLNDELERRVSLRTEALATSEERFRLVSMATNDVVWDWNLVNDVMWWSGSLSDILGYNASDMPAGAKGWFDLLHPDDRDRTVQGINNAINNGKEQWSGDYRIAKADGSYAYVSNRAYIMHNEYGMPYRVIGSFIDLSDLRATQEKLQSTNEHLLRVNADLDTFVYTASHDLKAPVANIEGLLLLLEDQIESAGPLPGMPTEPVFEMVKGAISRFKNVIKDLTDIAKVQRDLDNAPEPVELQRVVDSVILNIQEHISAANAQIHTDFEEAKLVNFSQKNLYSILYNLLMNAINYRSPERRAEIEVKTKMEDDAVVLMVRDNGLGMSKDNLSKIFTLFKRFHAHVDGTGMGLYIVKRMINNAGGTIEVESEEDKGTTFYVRFKPESQYDVAVTEATDSSAQADLA
ncbi:chemotaxis protein CheB [Pontibacter sp. CAU 1760]